MKMKQLLAFAICLTVTMACSNKTDQASQDTKSETSVDSNEWKAMDEFHMVMAETFHPYKDSADLAPVKEKVGELVAAADKWASGSIPGKVDNDEVKQQLQNLKSETEVLADLVQTGTDEAIGTQLTKLHDTFHALQETWYGAGDEHHHHEH